MTDIIERLREAAKMPKKKIMVNVALNEAADEIERLRAEHQSVERDSVREAALEEAAKVADYYAAQTPDNSLRIGAGWIAGDIRSLKSSSQRERANTNLYPPGRGR